MDLDNIIYIVVTIIIFVVSFLGQSKKKKNPAPVIDKEEELVYSLNDFEKILERKKEFRNLENEKELLNSEKNESKEEEEQIIPKKEARNESASSDEVNNDGFDIKSAVIYSSILQRKKFRR